MELRSYQIDGIDAAARDIGRGKKNVLIVAPTASGKSVIIAGIIKRALKRNPRARFLILCDQAELLLQIEEKIKALAPEISTGVFCADAGRKDTYQQVILASRDSLGRKPTACGSFEGVLVDEAHMVSVTAEAEKDNTMYARIVKALEPKWIVGLTGTPWRLNGGRIWGEGKFFETISFNIPMQTLREQGFLSPYSFPKVEQQILGADCRVASTGDFVIKDLEKIASSEKIVAACIDEWQRLASGRVCSMFFCVSRAHAKLVEKKLLERMPAWDVVYVDGETKDRESIYARIKTGQYKAVVSICCLTKGFDAPCVDCVVMLRATKSAALFIQAIGRSLRIAPGKKDALIIDFTDNFERFGSIEAPFLKQEGGIRMLANEKIHSTGKRGTKMCPACSFECSSSATTCPYCGEVFLKHGIGVFEGTVTKEFVISQKPVLQDYTTNSGRMCKRICYQIKGGKVVAEYFMVNDNNWSKAKLDKRWRQINFDDNAKLVGFIGRVSGSLVDIDELLFCESEEEV